MIFWENLWKRNGSFLFRSFHFWAFLSRSVPSWKQVIAFRSRSSVWGTRSSNALDKSIIYWRIFGIGRSPTWFLFSSSRFFPGRGVFKWHVCPFWPTFLPQKASQPNKSMLGASPFQHDILGRPHIWSVCVNVPLENRLEMHHVCHSKKHSSKEK